MEEEVTILLDNTDVLSRAQQITRFTAQNLSMEWKPVRGYKIKGVLFLDFDLWVEMETLYALVKLPIKWKKVDSHNATRTYVDGVQSKEDEYSIYFNEYVDDLLDQVKEKAEQHPERYPHQEFFYPHSQVMVQYKDGHFIYGKIGEDISDEFFGR